MMKPNDQQRITAMREGGMRLARVLHSVMQIVRPGATTGELDALAEQQIRESGGKASFKGYRGYPASLCTSVNEAVVHAIPRPDWKLRRGDIVGLDIGMVYNGYYTDMAVTVPVGEVGQSAKIFLAAARKALRIGLAAVRDCALTGDVGAAIQKYVEGAGYGVVRDLVGHGVGQSVHDEPQVPNFGRSGTGAVLHAGQTIAVEPMITQGDYRVRTLPDQWTVVTQDGSLAAHFEQTVAVTERGCDILTPFPWEKS